MSDLFKSFFSEGEAINYEQFNQKLGESGMKIVDINAGGYVDKNKYDRMVNEYTDYKSKNDVSKYADYDTIKSELQQYKIKEVEQQKTDKIKQAKVDDKFVRFIISEVDNMVNDKEDFDKCLEKYLKDNPQYITTTKPIITFGSSVNVEGDGKNNSQVAPTNKVMNALLRGARK